MTKHLLLLICLLLSVMMFAGNSFGVTFEDFDQYWQEFRKRFPYHIQVISLTPELSGYQAVIISEPPPHVSIESLKAITGISQVTVKEHTLGVDGYVRDLLCLLPKLENRKLDSILLTIHDYLFFSTYKAEVVEFPLPSKHKNQPFEYDIEVSYAEIDKWLLKDNPNFLPILGGKTQSFKEIISNIHDGVYISEEVGLVIWVIPRSKELLLEQFVTAARIWTLESDLIIGAIANDECLVIIGRERNTSVLDLPPLRTEEIMRLASANFDELAQSYERKHVFAGRFNETDDWAPIYLSNILIDTEYGSLLCLTDQLLKSWTLNGTVHYSNFNYADPVVDWAWSMPLLELLNTPELTFNWNTQGVGFAVDEPSNTIYGIGRTGALAVSYIPGGENAFWSDTGPDTNMVKYENKGYEFFARTGDPNLARVVQYASLFQIFREFDISATPPQELTPFKQYESLVELMHENLRNIQQLSTSDLFDNSLLWVAMTSDEYDSLSILAKVLTDFEIETFVDSLNELILIIKEFDRIDPINGIRKLSEELANFRQIEGKDNDFFERLSTSFDMSSSDFELYITKPENFDIYVYLIAQNISGSSYFGGIFKFFAGTAISKQRYQDGCQERISGWIRSPSTVISTADDIEVVGGHNLSKRLVRIKPNSKIKRGSPKIIEGPQGKILNIHPADLKSSSTNKVIRLFERSGGIKTAEVNIGRFAQTASREIRPISTGLFKGKMPAVPRAISTEFRNLGAKRNQSISLTRDPAYKEILESSSYPTMVVKAEGSSLKIFDMHHRGSLLTQTKSELVNTIVEKLRLNPQASTTLQIHIDGLTNTEITGIMQSVKIKLAATPNVKSAGMAISNQSGKLKPLSSVTRDVDFTRAQINNLTLIQITEGPLKGLKRISFDVDLPLAKGSGSKTMKLGVYLSKLKKGVIDKIKNAFSKTKLDKSKNESILIDIKRDLMNADETIKNIHIELEDILITELYLQEKEFDPSNEVHIPPPMYSSLYLAA